MAHKVKPNKPVAQYLSRYAEPEARLAETLKGNFGHALVIPAYGESDSLFQLLGSIPRPAAPVLIILVLNARADSPAKAHEANATARQRLARELSDALKLSEAPPTTAYGMPGGTLLLIDRATPGHFLPAKQGVGLARKIGNDMALALYASGRIASPWLSNSDADVVLPGDYFDQLTGLDSQRVSCAIYTYAHHLDSDPTLAEAGRLYEISLRYYVLGLAWAGSPYAFQSMGSCLAIPSDAYAKVRGFPRKNAAEDFYVLDKLAKVGPVARLAGSAIELEGRVSDRVPFGTGKALSELTSKKSGLAAFRLYHPLVFAHLAAWIRVMEAIARSGGDLEKPLGELPAGNPFLDSDLLQGALLRLGAFAAIRDAIGGSRDPEILLRHFHTWFDAFRTLRLLHLLRDGGLRSLPWRQALLEAPFTNLSASTRDDSESLLRALAKEERTLAATPAGLPALAARS